jgi:hypothetical protein
MAKFTHKMLHITIDSANAWAMLTAAMDEGWEIKWSDYANKQWHFLLMHDASNL